jgi:hypothetical protein
MNDKQIEHLSKVREVATLIMAKKRSLAVLQDEMCAILVLGSELGISGSDMARAADVSRQRVSQILIQSSQID